MFAELAKRVRLRVFYLFARDEVRHFQWRQTEAYSSKVLNAYRLTPRMLTNSFDTEFGVVAFGQIRAMLESVDLLIVLGWEQPAYLAALLAAKRRRIPYIVYTESNLKTRRVRKGSLALLRSKVLQSAELVWVSSESARQAVIADGVDSKDIVETINSIETDRFRIQVRRMREELSPPASCEAFLYVGQLIRRKNVGTLLEAFSLMSGTPTLDVVGAGEELKVLEAQAEALGLAERVRFRGFLTGKELEECYASCHVLVLPSLEEVYGMTAHEGFEAGLGVVVSASAGVADVLRGRSAVEVAEPSKGALFVAMEAVRRNWSGWRDFAESRLSTSAEAADEVITRIRDRLQDR